MIGAHTESSESYEILYILYASDLYTQDLDAVVEFMQRHLRIGSVNAFRFVSRLPITGIDRALVRGRGRVCH